MELSRPWERPSSTTAPSRTSTWEATTFATRVLRRSFGVSSQQSLLLIAFECRAPESAIQALGEALKQNSIVTTVGMGLNGIGEEGAEALWVSAESLVD